MYINEETQDLIYSRLTTDMLLDYANVDHVRKNTTNGFIRCKCPFHNGKDPNFAMSKNKPFKWKCISHGCGVGNAVTFIQKLSGVDFIGAWGILAKMTGVNIDNCNNYTEEDIKRYKKQQEENRIARQYGNKEEREKEVKAFEITEELIERLQSDLKLTDYHTKRNLDYLDAVLFELGYSPKSKELLYPLRDVYGHPVGMIGRDTTGNRKPKYMYYPKGLYRGLHLFMFHEAIQNKEEDYIILVEGSMDYFKLRRLGLNATAYLGNQPTKEQLSLIKKYYSRIIILSDNDETGAKCRKFVFDNLKDYVKLYAVYLPEQYKDIDEVPDNMVKDIIEDMVELN